MWCPACGGESIRGTAKFCADCGKLLSESYEPLDTIRASYRLQRTTLKANDQMKITTKLFDSETSCAAQTAWACVVYSMVPYLGILFVPLAFAASGFGYLSTRQTADRSRRVSVTCFFLSFAILGLQIVLWWLLYLIPTLAGGVPISN